MSGELTRAFVLAAFDVAEEDLAEFDPDGTLAETERQARTETAYYRDVYLPDRIAQIEDRLSESLQDGLRVKFGDTPDGV